MNIVFGLTCSTRVKVKVFNILDQKVTTLLDEKTAVSYHFIQFDAGNLPCGVYMYLLQAGDTV